MRPAAVSLILLILAALAAAVRVGYTGNCPDCHGTDQNILTVQTGKTCWNCHDEYATNYIWKSVHYRLNSATLYKTIYPREGQYCYCHSYFRAMDPNCACHVVIHINMRNHGYTFLYPILVVGYLPWGVSYPTVSPGLQFREGKLVYDCNTYCPPNLRLIWNQYSGSRNVVVVAVWDWQRGDVVLPLPGPGPTGIGGTYGKIENGSWLSCFSCHFLALSPWSVAAGYNGTPVTNPSTAFRLHNDTCQPCHGPAGFGPAAGFSTNVWTHNIIGSIYGGSDNVWSNCTRCHTAIASYVSSSVHSGIGCKCHAAVHIGYSYGGYKFAVLYSYAGSASPPSQNPASVNRWVLAYTQYNATRAVSALIDNYPRNIEVGLLDAFYRDYISTLPIGVGPVVVWTSCFNCHFLAYTPPLRVDPHKISGFIPAPGGGEGEVFAPPPLETRGGGVNWGVLAVAFVGLIGGLVLRRLL